MRVDLVGKRAIGFTLFNYYVLLKQTEIGFRNLPLTELNELPADIRETVIKILLTKPVNEVLSLLAFTQSDVESIPITSLQLKFIEKQAA